MFKTLDKQNFIYGIPLLVGIVFCIRLIHEPDLWWQLRTGEYILETGAVPAVDVFSFTYNGMPWLNVKWGFEVIQAFLVQIFGPTGLPIAQIPANILMGIFVIATTRNLAARKPSSAVLSLVVLLFYIGISYRMNGRPELVSYTFTAFYIYIFTQINQGKKRWIYALIPAQILWANLHEAYGVGLVLMAIFVSSNWFSAFFIQPKNKILKKETVRYSLVALLAWLGVALHPGGWRMLWHPYEIYTQLSENVFTQEIFGATVKEYWQTPAFLGWAIAAMAFLQLYRLGKPGSRFSFKMLLQRIPLFYILIFLSFAYLSFTSYRNLPFLMVSAAPLFGGLLADLMGEINERSQNTIVIATGITLYFSIVTNIFYKAVLPGEIYGWGIYPEKNAMASAQFIREHDLKGNAFSDYLSNAYLLWALQPDFKTFIDLRDLDVFEADDLAIGINACAKPEMIVNTGHSLWNELDSYYKFDYAVVSHNKSFLPIHRHLYEDKNYTLVSLDELCAIFVRNDGKNASLLKSTDLPQFSTSPTIQKSIFATIFWPFYTPENKSSKQYKSIETNYKSLVGITEEFKTITPNYPR